MNQKELSHIIAAIIVFTAVISFIPILNQEYQKVPMFLVFSIIIISVSIIAKKITASHYDADIEHEIWTMSRYGFPKAWHLKKPIPVGIILPLFITIFSLGLLKPLTFLTYETRALKRRAAKRHGYYSYAEMTDWHNGLIGASSIIALLALAAVAYFLPFSELELLAKFSIYYAFWNLLPISKLDGTQIFFGSRVLYTILAIITVVLTAFAFLVGNVI